MQHTTVRVHQARQSILVQVTILSNIFLLGKFFELPYISGSN